LVRRAMETGRQVVEIIPHSPKEAFEPMRATAMEGHTRAFVKIEDGCDRFCSYCIIPYARGRVRSKPLEELKGEIELLAQQGFREIVLTGINLSSYGKGEGFGLLDGVKTAAAVPGVQRVRLGSLEPDLTDDELIEGLAQVDQFCPQFHLSVQSGCDATLKRMNRRYTAEEYLRLCQKLRRAFDMPAITTDLMVGFAGETEEEFARTLSFLEQAGFAKVHVFPYSRRPGTAADRMEGQVTEEEKARRAARAAQAAEQSQRAFLQQMVGRIEPVLFERCNLPGIGRGHTPNGTQVQVNCGHPLRGRLLTVRLEGVTPDGLYCAGRILDL
ncbi:MAG: MiaB/RimO family radical SAM methylthiotransferase, partial [Oscillospiraceae bacterium]|nr:MiaB/RimO family radical SAM methylthiotransferase [Oscillospiraceae bacterium]